MLLISHRGNIFGKNPDRENSPDYIIESLTAGYSCEIDLRVKNNSLFLGHDEPQYAIDLDFLKKNQNKLWIHCKEKDAFSFCLSENLHCFWHQTDDYTITSFNYIWAYPGILPVGNKCIMVMPEYKMDIQTAIAMNPFGICSDRVGEIH